MAEHFLGRQQLSWDEWNLSDEFKIMRGAVA